MDPHALAPLCNEHTQKFDVMAVSPNVRPRAFLKAYRTPPPGGFNPTTGWEPLSGHGAPLPPLGVKKIIKASIRRSKKMGNEGQEARREKNFCNFICLISMPESPIDGVDCVFAWGT